VVDIDAIKADREAGAPGPWGVVYYDAGDCAYYDHNGPCPSVQAPDDCAIVHWDGFKQEYWSSANGNQRQIEANARRISRVPELEDAVIALTARVERLEDALYDAINLISALTGPDDRIAQSIVGTGLSAIHKPGDEP